MALDRSLVESALPGYEIDDEVGRGGWGAVYRGRHIALERDVAVKQLPRAFAADQRALDRFVDEARIIGQLDHPHIVKIFDFLSHEGMWLIVMEYLGGGTLWDRFNADGIRPDEACAIALAVCAGLQAAHDQGILHRDLKPENVMFATDGTVRLCDFGIARTIDRATRHTHVGEVVGTPTYMSPEQAMGEELGPTSDVYSLALVLYELLAGRLPFDEATSPTQQLIQRVTEEPRLLADVMPGLPDAIASVVTNALDRAPAERIHGAEAFGVALAEAAGASFGAGWLQRSGIALKGGGEIQSVALHGSSSESSDLPHAPVRPSMRIDHFRPAADAGAVAEPGSRPTVAPVGSPGHDVSGFGVERPSVPSSPDPVAEAPRTIAPGSGPPPSPGQTPSAPPQPTPQGIPPPAPPTVDPPAAPPLPPGTEIGVPPPPPGLDARADALEWDYAGFGRRLGALLLDSLVVSVIGAVAIVVTVALAPTEFVSCDGGTDQCEQLTHGGAVMLLTVLGALALAAMAYWVLLDGLWGRTLGRRVVGIAVLDVTEHRPIGIGRAIVRQIARIVSGALLGLGYLWMLWDSRSQTWHDKAARSRVVRIAAGAGP